MIKIKREGGIYELMINGVVGYCETLEEVFYYIFHETQE